MNIAVYSIYFQQFLEVELFVKIGNGKDKRLLKIANISSELGKYLCAALPVLHCFTGIDYTSVFLWNRENQSLRGNLFKSFGDAFPFNSELLAMVEKLVCKLYAVKTKNVNEGRYLKFHGKKKTPEPQQLPPTVDALLCHCKRVFYATAIIKQSLQTRPQSNFKKITLAPHDFAGTFQLI